MKVRVYIEIVKGSIGILKKLEHFLLEALKIGHFRLRNEKGDIFA